MAQSPSKPSNKPRRKKLNLTVTIEARQQAEELAALRHRSISNLFEYLVELEMKREERARKASREVVRESRDDPSEDYPRNSTLHRLMKAALAMAGSTAPLLQ